MRALVLALALLLIPASARADNITCSVCNIGNIGPNMGLGALVWAPICGFLEILFCIPILFALALIGVTFTAAYLSIRRR